MRESPEAGVESAVRKLVLEYASVAPRGQTVRLEASLRSELEIDSLALVSLTLRLGDELGIDFATADIDLSEVATVGDLVALGHALLRTDGTGGTPPPDRDRTRR